MTRMTDIAKLFGGNSSKARFERRCFQLRHPKRVQYRRRLTFRPLLAFRPNSS
jgi:hypothetical protein